MKQSDAILGSYQLAGGLISVTTLFAAMAQRHWSALILLFVLSALSVAAGILHLRSHPKRYSLSVANQLLQAVGFYTPWLSFVLLHGAGVRLAFLFDWKGILGSSLFNFTAAALFPESICDVDLFGTLPGLHTLGLSINLLALGLLFYCVRQRRKIERGSAPDSLAIPDASRT